MKDRFAQAMTILILAAPIVCWTVIYWLADVYWIEIIRSFWPYLVLMQTIFLVSLCLYSFFRKTKNLLPWIFAHLLLLLGGLLPLVSFYRATDVSSPPESDRLTILVSNIWWKNELNEDMYNKFRELDPDVLVLLEFTKANYDSYGQKLERDYQYNKGRVDGLEQGYVGKAVFSKFPISKFGVVEESTGANTFNRVELELSAEEILTFYAVHTTSPVTEDFYLRRNKQFRTLAEQLNNEAFGTDMIIAAGDYNLSPWSLTYKRFEENLQGHYHNVSNRGGFKYSWKANFAPFSYSHIDHAFVSNQVKLVDYKLVNIPGSDHKAQLITIAY